MAGVYKVKSKKGFITRAGAALDTEQVAELPFGTVVIAEEETEVDGKARLRLTSPVAAWGSKRLLTFECKRVAV